MRIIQLGSIDVTFRCQHCKTIWEVNTREINFEKDSFYWYVECPLCQERIKFNDGNDIIKFLERRKQLQEENNL